ncbi:MAG TPA: thioredoxin family protein [Treponemataceae bacterium]|nr:thioredoxin family protein [Treponemataceae bacterium]
MKPITFKSISKLILCLVVSLMLIACSSSPTEAHWLYDYEEAQELAEQENKNILLFFVGSDWDEVSIALSNDIFPSKSFISKIASEYILVQLDFPQDENLITEEQFYRNYDVANRFSLEGIPSAILTTKEGYIIDKYNEIASDEISEADRAADFIKQIQKSKKKSTTIISTVKKMDKTEGPKKANLVDTILNQLDPDYTYLHTDLIAQIPEHDPDNTTKLHEKYLLQLTYPKAMEALYAGDYENAIQMLIEVAENKKISKKDSQEAYYTAAYLNAQMGLEDEQTIAYLQLAYNVDPESEVAQNAQQIISMISLEMEEKQNTDFSEEYLAEDNAN